MNSPLTLEEANKICEDYQFLVGMPYDKIFERTTPVLAVLVAPFRECDQQDFVDDYDIFGKADMKSYNPARGFSVIVLARYVPDTEICLWMDIETFLRKCKIMSPVTRKYNNKIKHAV